MRCNQTLPLPVQLAQLMPEQTLLAPERKLALLATVRRMPWQLDGIDGPCEIAIGKAEALYHM